MASSYITKSGEVKYRVRWRPIPGDPKMQSETFDVEQDAKDFEATIRVDKMRGKILPLSGRNAPTLADVATWWVENHLLVDIRADQTREQYSSIYDRFIHASLGHIKVQRMAQDPRILSQWRADLIKSGIGNANLKKVFTVLSGILEQGGVKQGIITANPAHLLDVPANPEGEHVVRSLGFAGVELMRLAMLANVSAEGRSYTRRYEIDRRRDALCVSLMAYCGLRPGEVQRLQWTDCKEDHLTVTGKTKTLKSRIVPLPSVVAEELAEVRALAKVAGRGDSEFVLGRKEWPAHIWRNWQRRVWAPLAAELGKSHTDIANLSDSVPYSCRHGYADARLRSTDEGQFSNNPTAISRAMGNTMRTFLTHYTTAIETADYSKKVAFEEQIEQARDRVNELVAA